MNAKLYTFDAEFYKNTYKDLENDSIHTQQQCLAHYLTSGKKEGRCCSEIEMREKYAKQKEEAIYNIAKFQNTENKFFNILIRTSNRPTYFENCIQSILQQTYKNFHIYICYDKQESLDYLNKYEHHNQIDYFYVNNNSSNKYFFNLHCNELLKKIEKGYSLFLDDDDMFIHKRVLELLNWACGSYKIIGWKFLRPDKLIYKENMESPLELGEIDTAGLCFDFSLKDQSSWNDQQFGDYHYYKSLLDKCYPHEKYFFNYVLTCTQFDNKIGNFGESEYI